MTYESQHFDQDDMTRFMEDQFKPFLSAFQRHLETDERRFEQMTQAVQAVRTSIEVNSSVQQALVAQAEKITGGAWTKIMVAGILLAPFVAIGIAVWK